MRPPRAGGVSQNAGLRSCLIVPRQPDDPERERLALRLSQYLTAPRGNAKVFDESLVYDVPVVRGVKPKEPARPLMLENRWASLPVSEITGYDAQGSSEFWTAWQGLLGAHTDDETFLRELSAIHRRSLRRAYWQLAGDDDRAFIRAELGALPNWLN